MATAPRLKLIPIAMLAFPPRSASWNEEMEKRSRRRIRDLVAQPASLGLSENEIGCARIYMVARNTNVPFKGRIQKRKTYHLQIITFRLQRAAGPYRCAISRHEGSSDGNRRAVALRGGFTSLPLFVFHSTTTNKSRLELRPSPRRSGLPLAGRGNARS